MKWTYLFLVAVALCLSVIEASTEVDTNMTTAVTTPKPENPFKEVEKQLKTSVGKMIKMLLPHLMRGSSDSNVSGQCTASIMKIITGVRQLKEWAVRFIDATGKPPAGLLEGSGVALGDYDECLDIAVGKRDDVPQNPEDVVLKGQYCLLELHGTDKLNAAIAEFYTNPDAPIAKTKTFLNLFVKYKHLVNATMKFGICTPSKCGKEDIESMVQAESIRDQIGKITVLYCREKGDDVISLEQKILLCVLAVCLGCVLLGTVIDAFLRAKDGDKISKEEKISTMRYIIKKTSIYSNALELLNTDTLSSDPLSSLRGLRTLIVVVIIYSHTYANLHKYHFQKFTKSANFLRFFDSFTFAGIGNGSVTLDSIIFIVAMTISFNIWRYAPKRERAKLNVIKFILSRYVRVTAAQLLVIAVFLLFPVFGSGPFWNAYVDPMLDNCSQRWWLNVLFISNYWKTGKVCFYHTWIFSLTMQLILMGFVFLWILKKSLIWGVVSMLLMIVGGVVAVAVLTSIHDLPGTLAFFMLDSKSFPIAWDEIFQRPYDHFGPFLGGLMTGYFLAVKKEHLRIPKIISVLLWLCTLAAAFAVVFGLYEYRNGAKMDSALSIFYAIFHRNVWSMFIAWVVIACTTHHAGPLPRFLGSNFFVPLDRLSFITYIIHMPVIYFYWGNLRVLSFMGHIDLVFLATSFIGVSFLASFVIYIIFISPYFALEDYVCSFFKSKDKVSFSTKTAMKSISVPRSMNSGTEATENGNVCVNLGYSKSVENL